MDWKIFNRHPRAAEIAEGLKTIPSNWALTPVRDKRPYRSNWQHEQPVSREAIATYITQGQQLISQKTGKTYTAYDSGYGVRLGEISGGLLAIDVDGASAEPILKAICHELPKSVSWSSGKTGRYQIAFQIPPEYRENLKSFTRAVIRERGDVKADQDELLEFRYNYCQSVLPPSYHPDTGKYGWINSPEDTEVAIAPKAILDLLKELSDKERLAKTEAEAKKAERAEYLKQRKAQRQNHPSLSTAESLADILELDILPRLDTEDIYNWNGHNFKRHGKKIVGFCPQHGGTSGTSFQVNLADNSWYCHGCQEGGHAVQYRHFVNGGHGTPKGKDFVAVVEELANDAGVTLPEWQQQYEQYKSKLISSTEYNQLHKFPRQLKNAVTLLAKTLEKKVARPAYKYLRKHGVLPEKYELHPLEKQRLAQLKETERRRLAETTTTIVKSEPPLILGKKQIVLEDDVDTWNLPTDFEDWIFQGRPGYVVPPEKRNIFESLLVKRGIKNLLDLSGTGTGKSHDTGNLPPYLGINPHAQKSEDDPTLYYICDDPRNPTTESIESNSVVLPTRHSGLVEDTAKQTPLGYPHIRRPKGKEEPTIEASCIREPLFRYFPAFKNMTLFGGLVAAGCQGCPNLLNSEDKLACPLLIGRWKTKENESFIRSHPQQLSTLSQKDIAVVDEAGSILKSTKDIFVGSESLNEAFYELGTKLIEHQVDGLHYGDAIFRALSPLIQAMKEMMVFIDDSTKFKKNGLNHYDFIDFIFDKLANFYCHHGIITEHEKVLFLEAKSGQVNSSDALQLKSIKGSWIEKLINRALWNLTAVEFLTRTDVNVWGEVWQIEDKDIRIVNVSPTLKDVVKILKEVYKPDLENLIEDDSLPWETQKKRIDEKCKLNFLSPLLEIFTGGRGYIQAKSYGFYITQSDNHNKRSFSNAQSIIYKDATARTEDIAMRMGIDAEDILEYKVATPAATNLIVNLVDGFGICGAQRDSKEQREKGLSEASLPKRLIKGVEKIIADSRASAAQLGKKAKIALIDFMGQLSNYKDIPGIDYFGYWWVHNRGTNELQDYDVIIAIGNPTANLGAMAAEFRTLTGLYANPANPTEEFKKYIQHSVDSEKLQLVGRLRPHLQPHKQKAVYLLGDYSEKLTHQLKDKFPGCQINKMMAYDLCPEAATRRDLDTKMAIELGMKLVRFGQKVTQEKIAQEMECTQGWVSKIFKNLGGYKRAVKLFQFLNNIFYRNWNNSQTTIDALPEDFRWAAETYFPIEVQELLNFESIPAELISTLDIFKDEYNLNLLNYVSLDTIFGFILGLIPYLPLEYQEIFQDVLIPPEPIPIPTPT